ncbi:9832_t:CDS:10 [Racocetra fulgida]|uniref:9832_t:CDS:1 n=1 Tax=Racocetra fulgida TaxID=60492 RepID=A0A9N9AXJ4_9GLOM|nr:9832_t:CDS:10 [Racocetra fulgida]
MIRDDKKVLMLQKQQPVKPTIYLYTSAGKLLEQLQWDKGRIIKMGWTDAEQLVVVMEDGIIRLYDIHGDFTQFSLGKEAKDHLVIDCKIWGTGLVALTGNFKLIALINFDEPRPKLMADPEVFLATGSTILTVDAIESQDQQGPFTKMDVSPNGKFLALFTNEDVTEEIFKIGSTAPAAMLFDALEHFDKRSPKADENIRSIRTELADAVDACIEAAGHEFNQVRQRSLLKAAAFGKTFLESYNSDRFVEMCQILRVLNSIKKSTDDEETICRMIVEKLANRPGLSYAEIARTAHKQQDLKLLADFYYQDDRRVESANIAILESYKQKAVDEHIKLLQSQAQLEKDMNQKFVGLPLSETVHKCIIANQSNRANKLKSDFKIPDKRFVLKALVEMRDWEELDRFSKSKKSPIGYEPFVEECIKATQQSEAAKYIQRCDPAIRPGLYIKIGDFRAAGQEALAEIKGKCADQVIAQELDAYIAQATAR